MKPVTYMNNSYSTEIPNCEIVDSGSHHGNTWRSQRQALPLHDGIGCWKSSAMPCSRVATLSLNCTPMNLLKGRRERSRTDYLTGPWLLKPRPC